jgi:hypothetical protein
MPLLSTAPYASTILQWKNRETSRLVTFSLAANPDTWSLIAAMNIHFLRSLAVGVLLLAISGCKTQKLASEQKINLLQPHLLYSFLEKFGAEKDPDKVFNWEPDGTLRITGQHYGYMATRNEYSNYVLVAEFKWGGPTFAPRENNARDSGVLNHFVGKDHVWPKSIEAQIIEGGTGDILVVSGAKLTVDGVTKGPRIERFDRPGRNPWKDVKGFVGPNEIEKPIGQWNTMRILCEGDKYGIWVNGHKTLIGSNAVPQAGKILVQSEGAEIHFRKLDLYPIKD